MAILFSIPQKNINLKKNKLENSNNIINLINDNKQSKPIVMREEANLKIMGFSKNMMIIIMK